MYDSGPNAFRIDVRYCYTVPMVGFDLTWAERESVSVSLLDSGLNVGSLADRLEHRIFQDFWRIPVIMWFMLACGCAPWWSVGFPTKKGRRVGTVALRCVCGISTSLWGKPWLAKFAAAGPENVALKGGKWYQGTWGRLIPKTVFVRFRLNGHRLRIAASQAWYLR